MLLCNTLVMNSRIAHNLSDSWSSSGYRCCIQEPSAKELCYDTKPVWTALQLCKEFVLQTVSTSCPALFDVRTIDLVAEKGSCQETTILSTTKALHAQDYQTDACKAHLLGSSSPHGPLDVQD